MKEKPILFSTAMVRAILKGCKTMTRRVMKPQPKFERGGESEFDSDFLSWKDCQWMKDGIGFPESGIADHAPYKKGDLLWVRETWNRVMQTRDTVAYYKYKANFDDPESHIWKPSIFMPQEAARLFLEVTNIRAEQLQDITEHDAWAEGIKSYWLTKEAGVGAEDWHESSSGPYSGADKAGGDYTYGTRKDAFKSLWDSLNARRGYSWESNPWVWVIEFMRK